MAKKRSEVAKSDQWSVEDMYPNIEAWKTDLSKMQKKADNHFHDLQKFQEKFDKGAETLAEFLKEYFDELCQIEKIYVYSHLIHDVDIADNEGKTAHQMSMMLFHRFNAEMAWVEPGILQLEDEVFKQYLGSKELSPYINYLEKLAHQRKHVLSPQEEKILAASSDPLSAINSAFSSINNADLTFAPALDSEGHEHELTHAAYGLIIKSQDRQLRSNAFTNMHMEFGKYQNTIADLLSGSVRKKLFVTRVRGYESCLQAALFPNNIDVKVYKSLIECVRENLPTLHRYVGLRKRLLGVSDIHAYDMYVPVVKEVDIQYTFEEASQIIVDSLEVMGKDYTDVLAGGLSSDRWVDRYENENKRSGAYSSGAYGSKPYILMNYKGTFNDLMTLSHEAGHSMHSYHSNKNQPFWDAQYTIFVAEVASTFHEELTFRYLLDRAASKEEKTFIINQKIDAIRATLFRQTMFAEFELRIHEMAELGEPLTPGAMKAVYEELNRAYFGPEFTYDPELFFEYLRIPHFYSNFYVYQYATGVSAAFALVEKVLSEGTPAKEAYIRFLSSGCSDFPVESLKKAGVDITTKAPVQTLIDRFSLLTEELEKLT